MALRVKIRDADNTVQEVHDGNVDATAWRSGDRDETGQHHH